MRNNHFGSDIQRGKISNEFGRMDEYDYISDCSFNVNGGQRWR